MRFFSDGECICPNIWTQRGWKLPVKVVKMSGEVRMDSTGLIRLGYVVYTCFYVCSPMTWCWLRHGLKHSAKQHGDDGYAASQLRRPQRSITAQSQRPATSNKNVRNHIYIDFRTMLDLFRFIHFAMMGWIWINFALLIAL